MSKNIQGFLILLLLFAIFGCGEGVTSGDPLGTDSITVIAEPAAVIAGQDSLITATVVRLDDKIPATDRLVSFRITTNNSGGMFRSMNDKVDGQNKAVAVYTAGIQDPEKDVEDTIQVSLSNGSAAFVMITRTAGVKGYIVTVKAEPALLTSTTGVSLVTANVKDSKNVAINDASVTFACSGVCTAGTVTIPGPIMTNGAGDAVSSYKGASAGSDVIIATVTIPGVAGTHTGAATITVP